MPLMAENVQLRLRDFSSLIMEKTAQPDGGALRFKRYGSIQTSLTGPVKRHYSEQINDPDEFVRTLLELERVQIVTMQENCRAAARIAPTQRAIFTPEGKRRSPATPFVARLDKSGGTPH